MLEQIIKIEQTKKRCSTSVQSSKRSGFMVHRIKKKKKDSDLCSNTSRKGKTALFSF